MIPHSDSPTGQSAGCQAILAVSNSRRWAVMSLLFVASIINYLDRATVSIALPYLSADLHLGPESKGLVLSSFFWLYALLQIPVGWCTDRLNLRWMYAAHFALWSLACGFTGFAGSLGALLVMRMLLGIGESIYLPGGSKIVAVLFASQDRALPSGFFDSGTRVGLAVGAPLIAMLIVSYGWRRMFAMVASRHWRGWFHGCLPLPAACKACADLSFPMPLRAPHHAGDFASTASCWASAWVSSASIITGTCWSPGCRITLLRGATSR